MSNPEARPSSATRASSPASPRFGAFAVAFAVAGTLTYLLCLVMNWPLFTFHPATNRVAWGWEAGRSGEGPAMYWYGWTATTLLVAAAAGLLATLLPERVTRKFPLTLVWLLPVLALPYLTYDLRQWWLHP